MNNLSRVFLANTPPNFLNVIFYLMFDALLVKKGIKHASENNIQKAWRIEGLEKVILNGLKA